MAALTIPPALMFGFWLLYKLVPPLPISEASTIFVLLGVTGLSIMAVVVFFRPMWKIHGAMVRAKADFQNKAALIIFPKETRLRELIGQGKWKDNETRELEEQLEKLRKIYPPDLKYRTWPFNSGILLAFFTTQIAPIITLFTVLRDFT